VLALSLIECVEYGQIFPRDKRYGRLSRVLQSAGAPGAICAA